MTMTITALGSQSEGKRVKSRLTATWRRTVEKERNTRGWTSWNMARAKQGPESVKVL